MLKKHNRLVDQLRQNALINNMAKDSGSETEIDYVCVRSIHYLFIIMCSVLHPVKSNIFLILGARLISIRRSDTNAIGDN